MSKLKTILLLLIAALIVGCASQPQQPKEEPRVEKPVVQEQPAVQEQPVEAPPAEEKSAEPEKAPEPQQPETQNTQTDTTVYFAPNMYMIDTFTAHKLDSIAEQLKAKNVTKLKLVGHSAKLDSAREEEQLSLQRAIAVAQYFESIGAFDADSITIEADGATHPAGSHAEITQRKSNRRVELYY